MACEFGYTPTQVRELTIEEAEMLLEGDPTPSKMPPITTAAGLKAFAESFKQ